MESALKTIVVACIFGCIWLLIERISQRARYPYTNWRHGMACSVQLTLLFAAMDWATPCATTLSPRFHPGSMALLFLLSFIAFQAAILIKGAIFPSGSDGKEHEPCKH
jgi:hypothetical protein